MHIRNGKPSILAIYLVILVVATLAGIAGCKGVQQKKNDTTNPSVTSLTYVWGNVSDQQTSIKSEAEVKNPYPFAIVLKTIEYQVLLGDAVVVQGVISKNQEMTAGSQNDVNFEVLMDNARFSQLWATHLKNKERTTFTYKGDMVFDLRAMEFKYPFKQSYEIKTNLLGK